MLVCLVGRVPEGYLAVGRRVLEQEWRLVSATRSVSVAFE